jgi:transposase
MQIIAETSGDMKAFENSGKLTGWTGLRPRNDESAGKYKSKFEQLCIRKSRKKALIAIARKLLTVVWHVLEEKQPFNPRYLPVIDLNKLEMKIKYHRREIDKLEQLGYCTA